jgi:hypothetical protein
MFQGDPIFDSRKLLMKQRPCCICGYSIAKIAWIPFSSSFASAVNDVSIIPAPFELIWISMTANCWRDVRSNYHNVVTATGVVDTGTGRDDDGTVASGPEGNVG